MSNKIKRIASGKNITILVNGIPRMFMCGEQNNNYFFEFLNMCQDDDKIEKVLSDPLYENYIKTYNEYPVGQELFSHGHKVQYLYTDKALNTYYKTQENEVKKIISTKFLNISDAAVPLTKSSTDEAKKIYVDCMDSEPYNLITCCSKCKTIYSVEDLINNKTNQIIKEIIKNV